MNTFRQPLHCIIPPYIFVRLLGSTDPQVRLSAMSTLLTTVRLRGERGVRAEEPTLPTAAAPGAANGERSIYDCRNATNLARAVLVRSEGDAPTGDVVVNRAYDGLGDTRQYYRDVHARNSIDGAGLPLDGYVHRGRRYNNAFWDGRQMVFGDGDGEVFTDFTASLDVIAHELTHGVTEFTAALEYRNQSGALNESISDVFGSLVKQWKAGQTADQADWLIGTEVFTPGIEADALRSMKAPGTAYDNELLGKDPQPGHMDDYVQLPDTEEGDNGGVHINSGIPNRAFYLAASGIGGRSWEAPGAIWYAALLASGAQDDFATFAATTVAQAATLYGESSSEQAAVREAWAGVGITVGAAAGPTSTSTPRSVDAVAALTSAGVAAAVPSGEPVVGGLAPVVDPRDTVLAALTAEVAALSARLDQVIERLSR
ncbi:M4 family metallopeptidase [Nakamurella flava]|nr:M4 family metallopeptidase [Nakamurella flava]